MISPLLANVYLHYVFDLWIEVWRQKVASGEVVVVRYADDLVVGFQHRNDAERFLKEFRQLLASFALELHPEKTRLIEFGRFAQLSRDRRGEGKAETFTFLGFTHYCATNSKGYFGRGTQDPTQADASDTAAEIKAVLRERMHERVNVVGQWLKRVVEGYYRYHAVPGNTVTLGLPPPALQPVARHAWPSQPAQPSELEAFSPNLRQVDTSSSRPAPLP